MRYMKTLFAFIFLSLSLLSCSGNENENKGNLSSDDSSQKNDATAGPGFSCLLDGVQITGNAIDNLQLQNTAFIYPNDAGGKRLLFFLVSSENAAKTKKGCMFKIRCPDQVGTYMQSGLDNRKNKCHITLSFSSVGRLDYYEDSITITINSITPSRITGNFSGTLSDALRKHVIVRDGKFDIPFSTGNLRPE